MYISVAQIHVGSTILFVMALITGETTKVYRIFPITYSYMSVYVRSSSPRANDFAHTLSALRMSEVSKSLSRICRWGKYTQTWEFPQLHD